MKTLGKLAAVLVLSVPFGAAAQPKLEPGNWALKTATTVNGKAEPDDIQEVCLDDELKDIAGYFSPKLEGVRAQCRTTKKPSKANTLAHVMQCKGSTFTMEATTSVTIENPRSFKAMMRIDTRNKDQPPYLAVADAQAKWTGPCKKP